MNARAITNFAAAFSLFSAALLAMPGGAQAAHIDPTNPNGGLLNDGHGLTKIYPDFYLDGVGGLSFNYNATTGILLVGKYETGATGLDLVCVDETETCTGSGLIGSYSEYFGAPQLQVMNYPITSGTGAKPDYKEGFSLYAKLDTTNGNVLEGAFRIDGVVRTFTTNPVTAGCGTNNYNCVLHDGSLDNGGLLSGSLIQFGWDGFNATNGILEFKFGNADGMIPLDGGYTAGGMKLYPTGVTGVNFETGNILTTSWSATTGFGDVFVPIPAAVWLFGSGMVALLGVARRKSRD